MLDAFNSYDDRLKFTHEVEENGCISFLDLKIIRDKEKTITNWYQKPTFLGRFLNFQSHHPFTHKKGVIFNLVDRAILLSEPKFHKQNISKVKKLLLNNNYPKNIVNKFVTDRYFYCMDKLSSSSIASNIQITHLPDSNNNNSIENKKMYLKVPHIKKFYSNISRKLKSFNICTVPKINYFMDKIIKRGKDKVEKIDQTNVVYKNNCN